MEEKRKIAVILTFAVALCLVLVSLARAEEKAKSLKWVDHKPNPRFAIYDPGTPEDEGDDLVLDKQTKLVWARNANLASKMLTWGDAITYCQNLTLGNFKGWQLPAEEQLLSLVDPSQSVPALPSGHPFVNAKSTYWSSTEYDFISALVVHIGGSGDVHDEPKIIGMYVLPVLGR
jgi:hypothetical protein